MFKGSPRGACLVDGALGVEFGSEVGAADQAHRDAGRLSGALQFALRFRPAQTTMVSTGSVLVAVDGDVQPGVVDAFVAHASDHLHAAFLEQRAAYPAGRFGQSVADLRRLALHQIDLARRGFAACGVLSPPRWHRSDRCPIAVGSAQLVSATASCTMRQEFPSTSDAAGADDGE